VEDASTVAPPNGPQRPREAAQDTRDGRSANPHHVRGVVIEDAAGRSRSIGVKLEGVWTRELGRADHRSRRVPPLLLVTSGVGRRGSYPS